MKKPWPKELFSTICKGSVWPALCGTGKQPNAFPVSGLHLHTLARASGSAAAYKRCQDSLCEQNHRGEPVSRQQQQEYGAQVVEVEVVAFSHVHPGTAREIAPGGDSLGVPLEDHAGLGQASAPSLPGAHEKADVVAVVVHNQRVREEALVADVELVVRVAVAPLGRLVHQRGAVSDDHRLALDHPIQYVSRPQPPVGHQRTGL